MNIIVFPDPMLFLVSSEVSKEECLSGDFQKFIDDMYTTMHKSEGIGLAAIQVAVPKRLFVVSISQKLEDNDEGYTTYCDDMVLINPEIVEYSEQKTMMPEGCLSIPEEKVELKRSKRITVQYMDRYYNLRTLKASGWLARCIMHENDHLNGKLLVHHVSALKRGMISQRIRKRLLENKRR
ncbi:MAG: peptide deformylase [Candidatus Xenolissoclinum pacificiensis L6]|uniref:Peptide deformylase n=1 Tax=Candidatus Xenolissoclinum pacificiensis L6 TaxID=1401685 RepID=W2V008_9RICK|nr:MAG: peptide deformylase [Candidatus Xenolissoclinum pacificiensis L6]